MTSIAFIAKGYKNTVFQSYQTRIHLLQICIICPWVDQQFETVNGLVTSGTSNVSICRNVIKTWFSGLSSSVFPDTYVINTRARVACAQHLISSEMEPMPRYPGYWSPQWAIQSVPSKVFVFADIRSCSLSIFIDTFIHHVVATRNKVL